MVYHGKLLACPLLIRWCSPEDPPRPQSKPLMSRTIQTTYIALHISSILVLKPHHSMLQHLLLGHHRLLYKNRCIVWVVCFVINNLVIYTTKHTTHTMHLFFYTFTIANDRKHICDIQTMTAKTYTCCTLVIGTRVKFHIVCTT